MAYSDYGAMIWKNGKLLDNSEQNYDSCRLLRNGKWTVPDYQKDDLTDKVSLEGHAVIVLDDYCIAFYKNFGLSIIKYNGSTIINKTAHLSRESSYLDEMFYDITYWLSFLDSNESIIFCTFKYKTDNYCVISGSSVGHRYNSHYITKILKKLVSYKDSDYYLNTSNFKDADSYLIIDHYIRKDNIRFEKYLAHEYGFKPMIKDLLKLNFSNALFHFRNYQTYKANIKYMK